MISLLIANFINNQTYIKEMLNNIKFIKDKYNYSMFNCRMNGFFEDEFPGMFKRFTI